MMTPEELLAACYGVRRKELKVDEALVASIEAEAKEYLAQRREPVPQMPPEILAARLPLLGWLIYEASLESLQRIDAGFEALAGDPAARSRANYELVCRVANAFRQLPWQEFAPRGLGALRAQALAASKRDTPQGYDAAWQLHDEARERYLVFKESHAGGEEHSPYVLALEETQIQLALAETGTACRSAELAIGRWLEEVTKGTWEADAEEDWLQRMFRDLIRGVETGEEAIDLVRWVDKTYGLVHTVDEHRLVMTTAYQNPAIMTARAALLMYSLTPELEPDRLDRQPPWNNETWEDARHELLRRFRDAYRLIELPALNELKKTKSLGVAHLRSLIQLRLHLTLVSPGAVLPSRLPKFEDDPVPPCLDHEVLDEVAVTELSKWLADFAVDRNGRPVLDAHGKPKRNGDANVIGSATMPTFIRTVEDCRRAHGVTSGYRQWRRDWPVLDRYDGEEGRRDRVAKLLDDA